MASLRDQYQQQFQPDFQQQRNLQYAAGQNFLVNQQNYQPINQQQRNFEWAARQNTPHIQQDYQPQNQQQRNIEYATGQNGPHTQQEYQPISSTNHYDTNQYGSLNPAANYDQLLQQTQHSFGQGPSQQDFRGRPASNQPWTQGLPSGQNVTTQLPPGPPVPDTLYMDSSDDGSLRAVRDLPHCFHVLYDSFRYFNTVQSECYASAYETDMNMVISAPTGSGKTGVMELSLLRMLSKQLDAGGQHLTSKRGAAKAVYIAPLRALCQEKLHDWTKRFGVQLGLNCLELTGDSEPDSAQLDVADIICTTPEKFDSITRRLNERGGASFFSEIALVMIDEVHLLGEHERGSALEAGVVSRIKTVSKFPDMAEMPLGHVRFVAVSATIPNVRDIGLWLQVPSGGLKVFGEEVRPVKLKTVVRSFRPSKNDFMFEKLLSGFLPPIITEFSKGKPTLVFCSSRKGTIETAQQLVLAASRGGSASGFSGSQHQPHQQHGCSPYIKDRAHMDRLLAAAKQMQNAKLGEVIAAGVGTHSAGLDGDDRLAVERLFLSGDLLVLCTTSTLALGVNLPAHLVIIKGTRRYCGNDTEGSTLVGPVGTRVQPAPGGGAGGTGGVSRGAEGSTSSSTLASSTYREYDRSVCLQMVGRAGRPQFDTEGVAVIMTQTDTAARYQNLLAGAEEVESGLGHCFAEHLNAEIVLQTVKSVQQAAEWLHTTFMYIRMKNRPALYGVASPQGRPLLEHELDAALMEKLVLENVRTLSQHGLVLTNGLNGSSLMPAEPGRLMAHHCISLKTMVRICTTPAGAGMMQLLRLLAKAEEFQGVRLKRSDKKLLNSINARVGEGSLQYFLPESTDPSKRKRRVASDAEKVFLLIGDALSDASASDAMDYAMKHESDQIVRVSQRIASCMTKYFAHKGELAATANALQLLKALKHRMWEGTTQQCRQLPNIGPLISMRLAQQGLGSLRALSEADARRIELLTDRNYPFGSKLKQEVKLRLPPRVTISLIQAGRLSGGRIEVNVTVTREPPARQNAGATAGLGLANGAAAATHTPAWLIVGSCHNDKLLVHKQMVVESFPSPFTTRIVVEAPAEKTGEFRLIASVVLDHLVGLDEVVTVRLPAHGQSSITEYLRSSKGTTSSPPEGAASVRAKTGWGAGSGDLPDMTLPGACAHVAYPPGHPLAVGRHAASNVTGLAGEGEDGAGAGSERRAGNGGTGCGSEGTVAGVGDSGDGLGTPSAAIAGKSRAKPVRRPTKSQQAGPSREGQRPGAGPAAAAVESAALEASPPFTNISSLDLDQQDQGQTLGAVQGAGRVGGWAAKMVSNATARAAAAAAAAATAVTARSGPDGGPAGCGMSSAAELALARMAARYQQVAAKPAAASLAAGRMADRGSAQPMLPPPPRQPAAHGESAKPPPARGSEGSGAAEPSLETAAAKLSAAALKPVSDGHPRSLGVAGAAGQHMDDDEPAAEAADKEGCNRIVDKVRQVDDSSEEEEEEEDEAPCFDLLDWGCRAPPAAVPIRHAQAASKPTPTALTASSAPSAPSAPTAALALSAPTPPTAHANCGSQQQAQLAFPLEAPRVSLTPPVGNAVPCSPASLGHAPNLSSRIAPPSASLSIDLTSDEFPAMARMPASNAFQPSSKSVGRGGSRGRGADRPRRDQSAWRAPAAITPAMPLGEAVRRLQGTMQEAPQGGAAAQQLDLDDAWFALDDPIDADVDGELRLMGSAKEQPRDGPYWGREQQQQQQQLRDMPQQQQQQQQAARTPSASHSPAGTLWPGMQQQRPVSDNGRTAAAALDKLLSKKARAAAAGATGVPFPSEESPGPAQPCLNESSASRMQSEDPRSLFSPALPPGTQPRAFESNAGRATPLYGHQILPVDPAENQEWDPELPWEEPAAASSQLYKYRGMLAQPPASLKSAHQPPRLDAFGRITGALSPSCSSRSDLPRLNPNGDIADSGIHTGGRRQRAQALDDLSPGSMARTPPTQRACNAPEVPLPELFQSGLVSVTKGMGRKQHQQHLQEEEGGLWGANDSPCLATKRDWSKYVEDEAVLPDISSKRRHMQAAQQQQAGLMLGPGRLLPPDEPDICMGNASKAFAVMGRTQGPASLTPEHGSVAAAPINSSLLASGYRNRPPGNQQHQPGMNADETPPSANPALCHGTSGAAHHKLVQQQQLQQQHGEEGSDQQQERSMHVVQAEEAGTGDKAAMQMRAGGDALAPRSSQWGNAACNNDDDDDDEDEYPSALSFLC